MTLAREGEAVDIPEREVRDRAFRTRRAGRMPIYAVFRGRVRQGHLCTLARSRHGQGTSAATATSPICAGRKSDPFTADDLITLAELEAASLPRSPTPEGEERRKTGPACWTGARGAGCAAARYVPRRWNSCRGVSLNDDAAARVRSGNAVIVRGRDAPPEADEACAMARGKLVADRRHRGRHVPPAPRFLPDKLL